MAGLGTKINTLLEKLIHEDPELRPFCSAVKAARAGRSVEDRTRFVESMKKGVVDLSDVAIIEALLLAGDAPLRYRHALAVGGEVCNG